VAVLRTRTIRDQNELITHFDQSAGGYQEAHGGAQRLLDYRLALIRQRCEGWERGVLLELGCGTAIHLTALAPAFSRVIGTDISAGMIRAAWQHVQASPHRDRIELRVDSAEELRTVDDDSVDVVLCVGAIEHMLDQARVVRQVARVLKHGGVFIVLTPNGNYCWYTLLAPYLGISTRHLSTDRFLTRRELTLLLKSAGLPPVDCSYWTFIPKGDIPRWTGSILEALDRLGRLRRIIAWRGGLILSAAKDV
jgi:ubiquinone/menaquinone biosynthesis C-methylase UbiE